MPLLIDACYGGGVVHHGGVEEPRPAERNLAMATAAPLQPAAPHRGIRALLARHPLVSFFVLVALTRGRLGHRPEATPADATGEQRT